MYCQNCGSENPDTSAFCRKCGSSLSPSASPEYESLGESYQTPASVPSEEWANASPVQAGDQRRPNNQQMPNGQSRPKRGKVVIIVVVILAVLAIGGGVAFMVVRGNQPGPTMDGSAAPATTGTGTVSGTPDAGGGMATGGGADTGAGGSAGGGTSTGSQGGQGGSSAGTGSQGGQGGSSAGTGSQGGSSAVSTSASSSNAKQFVGTWVGTLSHAEQLPCQGAVEKPLVVEVKSVDDQNRLHVAIKVLYHNHKTPSSSVTSDKNDVYLTYKDEVLEWSAEDQCYSMTDTDFEDYCKGGMIKVMFGAVANDGAVLGGARMQGPDNSSYFEVFVMKKQSA